MRIAALIREEKVLQFLGKCLTETVLNWISIILLCVISVACIDPAFAPLNIRVDADQTVAGGNPITLSASLPTDEDTVTWSLDENSPGKLDSDSGSTVRYLPPAAGTIVHPASITVSATVAGVTRTILLNVHPSMPASLGV